MDDKFELANRAQSNSGFLPTDGSSRDGGRDFLNGASQAVDLQWKAPGAQWGRDARGVAPGGPSFADYWRLAIKYRTLVTTVTAVIVGVTMLYSLVAPRYYTAQSTVKIGTYSPVLRGNDFEDSAHEQTRDLSYINTEVEILRSLSLADRIFGHPEMTGLADYIKRPRGIVAVFKPIIDLFQSDATVSGSNGVAYRTPVKLLLKYLKLVDIEQIRGTSLARIAVTTTDPALSSQLANLHAEMFIQQVRDDKQTAAADSFSFLKSQAEELARKVSNVEREMASYAEDNAIVSLTNDENIVVKKMAELNQLLTEATAKRIKSESSLKEAESGSGVNSTSLDDESVQRLRVELEQASSEYAMLAEKFKPTYPKMVQLKARVDSLRENLKQQRGQAVKGLEAQYKADAAIEKELSEQLEMQKSKAFDLSRRQVQYNILRREYESLKDLHQSVLRQLKESQVSSEATGTNITVIDRAAVPTKPSSPKTAINILLALFLSPLLGFGLALAFEALDHTIHTPDEAQQILGLASLGVVPMFGEHDRKIPYGQRIKGAFQSLPGREGEQQGETALAVRQDDTTNGNLVTVSFPRSLASEAFRTIRTSILLSSADSPPRKILVTSAKSGEGKTTLSSNLSVTLSQSGHKTVLIDADLRRPSVAGRFGFPNNGPGLVELLVGEKTLDDVLTPTEQPNLHIICAGTIPPNPAELVGSKKMAELLQHLAQQFDYVIVDSPPVVPVSDAIALSRSVDGIVFVVKGHTTNKTVARTASNQLRAVGARILGVVLNDVNLKKGDYYYYYRDTYTNYYIEEDRKRSGGKRA